MSVSRALLPGLALASLAALAGALPARAEEQAAPAPGCAEAVALRAQRFYEGVEDLSADFEQTARVATLGDAPGGEEGRTRGKVLFAKPGRMRWEYREPAPSLVVTDGKTLWTYDESLREAQRLSNAEGVLSGAAIQFLLGEGKILESFEVSAEDCSAERVRLVLVPREPATYERLAIEVERDGMVRASEVADLFGNVTRVVFADVHTNTRPPAERFRFEPPQGVRVIEVPSGP